VNGLRGCSQIYENVQFLAVVHSDLLGYSTYVVQCRTVRTVIVNAVQGRIEYFNTIKCIELSERTLCRRYGSTDLYFCVQVAHCEPEAGAGAVALVPRPRQAAARRPVRVDQYGLYSKAAERSKKIGFMQTRLRHCVGFHVRHSLFQLPYFLVFASRICQTTGVTLHADRARSYTTFLFLISHPNVCP